MSSARITFSGIWSWLTRSTCCGTPLSNTSKSEGSRPKRKKQPRTRRSTGSSLVSFVSSVSLSWGGPWLERPPQFLEELVDVSSLLHVVPPPGIAPLGLGGREVEHPLQRAQSGGPVALPSRELAEGEQRRLG